MKKNLVFLEKGKNMNHLPITLVAEIIHRETELKNPNLTRSERLNLQDSLQRLKTAYYERLYCVTLRYPIRLSQLLPAVMQDFQRRTVKRIPTRIQRKHNVIQR